VGRLDLDSEGLILLTNDGELANHLTHPRYQHEKTIAFWLQSDPMPNNCRSGGGVSCLKMATHSTGAGRNGCAQWEGMWLRIVMKEGKKRQIREVGKQIGLPVVKILRVRIGTFIIGQFKSPRVALSHR